MILSVSAVIVKLAAWIYGSSLLTAAPGIMRRVYGSEDISARFNCSGVVDGLFEGEYSDPMPIPLLVGILLTSVLCILWRRGRLVVILMLMLNFVREAEITRGSLARSARIERCAIFQDCNIKQITLDEFVVLVLRGLWSLTPSVYLKVTDGMLINRPGCKERMAESNRPWTVNWLRVIAQTLKSKEAWFIGAFAFIVGDSIVSTCVQRIFQRINKGPSRASF